MKLNEARIDRSQIKVFSSFAEADKADRAYWLAQSPTERRKGLRLMYQVVHGDDFELPEDISDNRVLEILLTS